MLPCFWMLPFPGPRGASPSRWSFPWGKVTVSAGIAEFEPGMGSLELLIAAADRALFCAGEQGGDRYAIAGTRAEVFADREEPHSPSTQRGSLRLESSPDRGFQLVPAPRLPGAEASSEDGGARDQEVALPEGTERVLVVDGDVRERARVAGFMKSLGYEVIEAPDGHAALAIAHAVGGPDLLLTDLIMPVMSGFTLTDRLEADFGPQRALYLSGYVQGEVSWRGAPGSQVGFVAKPANGVELALTARELLDCPLTSSEPAPVTV